MKNKAIQSAYELLQKSILYYQGNPVGTAAAVHNTIEAANYKECFVRDFVPSALVFLMDGETKIVGRPSFRDIVIELLLHGDFTFDSLKREYDSLCALRLFVGLLQVDGKPYVDDAAEQFSNCMLIQVQPIPMGGQQTPQPIKDDAGCYGGWIWLTQLTFRQMLDRLKPS